MATETMEYNEKRTNSRYEGVYAEFELIRNFHHQSGDSNFKTAFIRNFSLSGISLYISDELSLDDHVRIRLYDPNTTVPIVAFCSTIWMRKTRYGATRGQEHFNVGFKIIKLDNDGQRRLDNLILHFEALRAKKFNILEYT